MRIEPLGSGRRVTIVLSREPDNVQDILLTGPPRVVIDLSGPRPTGGVPIIRLPFTDDLVTQARVGAHGANLRAVLDLARDPGRHVVRREGNNLIVELGDVTAAAPADDSSDVAWTSGPLEHAEGDAAPIPRARVSDRATVGSDDPTESHPQADGGGTATAVKVKTIVNEAPKVGRNDPCPCGSGKKYKKCCGKHLA